MTLSSFFNSLKTIKVFTTELMKFDNHQFALYIESDICNTYCFLMYQF